MYIKMKNTILVISLLLGVMLSNTARAEGDVTQPPAYVPGNPVLTHASNPGGETNISNDGSISYSYPILLPPGRGNVDPSLSISYNSNNRTNGIVGVGFSLSMPSIELSTKRGLNGEKHYLANGKELAKRTGDWGAGYYGARIEEDFTKYFYNGNYWKVITRDGIKSYYGKTGSSKQGSFKWHLSRVEDTNGNFTEYNYTKNPGNTNTATARCYLESITYTHSIPNNDNGIFTVGFEYEPSGDTSVSYKTHAPVGNGWLLSGIKVYVDTAANEPAPHSTGGDDSVRSYYLNYTKDPNKNDMSFLSSIVAIEDSNTPVALQAH